MPPQKSEINVNNIIYSLIVVSFSFFTWEASRLVSSVDVLTKMVYQHEVILQEHEKRIDFDEKKQLSSLDDPYIPQRDGTKVILFNSDICLTSSSSTKKKQTKYTV